MNLIIAGPQGSGKGTQGDLLQEKLGLIHLETGDNFRAEIAKKTELGKECASYMDQGILLPDQIVFRLVEKLLDQQTLVKGFVLDGMPRRLSQTQWLDNFLAGKNSQIDKLVLLNISEKETIRRLSARRVCPQCGRNFNLITMPPRKDGLCDDCRIRLITRSDETPKAIKKRLKEYHDETDPMIDYYRQKGKVVEINGEQPVEKVFQDILKALG